VIVYEYGRTRVNWKDIARENQIRPTIIVDVTRCDPGESAGGWIRHDVGRILERSVAIAQGDQIARCREIQLPVMIEIAEGENTT
jgi:hypothetical protein